MAEARYENFVIQNKLDELLETKLSMSQFLTVDTTLTETDGMIKNVHVYKSTGSGETVEEGKGNTDAIVMSYDSVPYTVGTYQARFVYTDEAAMTDSFMVDGGITNLAKDIVNEYNTQAITELEKTENEVEVDTISFDAFADAIALLDLEDAEEAGFVALCNPAMKAELRKALKDELKYVEGFARTGYIGTVCGIPVYTSKIVSDGVITISNKEAVTAFMKKDTEIEQERDANTRTNTIYSRNVKVIALTNQAKAAKITVG